jgi:hypothetical protein
MAKNSILGKWNEEEDEEERSNAVESREREIGNRAVNRLGKECFVRHGKGILCQTYSFFEWDISADISPELTINSLLSIQVAIR